MNASAVRLRYEFGKLRKYQKDSHKLVCVKKVLYIVRNLVSNTILGYIIK